MFCKNCGKQLDDDAKFCVFCGRSVFDKQEQSDSAVSYSVKQEDVILDEAKRLANKTIIQGIIWLAVGFVITWVTYSFAEPGGTYFILYGPVLVGIYLFFKGVYYRIFPKQLLNKTSKINKEQKEQPK